MARIVELIFTTEKRGMGVDGDPIRLIEQWFEKDGTLIFEKDPCEHSLYAIEEINENKC